MTTASFTEPPNWPVHMPAIELARISRNGRAIHAFLPNACRAKITNLQRLSSYNWFDTPPPTIAVPGIPPLWSPSGAQQLQKNEYGSAGVPKRYTDTPLEALFRAVYITNPSFDIRPIDVVCDRTLLMKLFSYVNDKHLRGKLASFMINVEVVKNTAIFYSTNLASTLPVELNTLKGYNREFKEAYTIKQIRDSASYQRIISYSFGGLNYLVRYESDGYVNTTLPEASIKPESDCLSNMMGTLSQSSKNKSPHIPSPGSELTIQEVGHVVSPESLIEIRTDACYTSLNLDRLAPQLWMSQTYKLVRGFHHNGMFEAPEVQNVGPRLYQWEKFHRNALRRFAGLIKSILVAVEKSGGNALVSYDKVDDQIRVYKSENKNVLPAVLYSKWDDKNYPAAETDTTDEDQKRSKGRGFFSLFTKDDKHDDGAPRLIDKMTSEHKDIDPSRLSGGRRTRRKGKRRRKHTTNADSESEDSTKSTDRIQLEPGTRTFYSVFKSGSEDPRKSMNRIRLEPGTTKTFVSVFKRKPEPNASTEIKRKRKSKGSPADPTIPYARKGSTRFSQSLPGSEQREQELGQHPGERDRDGDGDNVTPKGKGTGGDAGVPLEKFMSENIPGSHVLK